MTKDEKNLSLAILTISALLSDKRMKERYEGYLKVVRELEFYLNVAPDDLEQLSAFFAARARSKRLVKDAVEVGLKSPLQPESEIPDVA